MQESGLLETIPLIITLTRIVYSFCLKSVLQATLATSAVTKDLIVGNLISSRVPPGFMFMDRFKGLWLDACSISCLLIWLANFLVHSVLYSLQPQKKLLSLERFLNSQRSWLWASTWTGHQFSSVQFSHSVMSNYLPAHESQHARPPCPSPSLRVHSDSRSSSQWCHPAISSSVAPFSPASNPSQHQSQRT